MQFIIHGVDRSSGQDTTLSVDAANATQAESIASLTMLVAEVKPAQSAPAPTVAYATAITMPVAVDWSSGIVRQARYLRGLSWMMAGIGLMALVWSGFSELGEVTYLGSFDLLPRVLRFLMPHADLLEATLIFSAACLMRLTAHFMLGIREWLLRKLDRHNS